MRIVVVPALLTRRRVRRDGSRRRCPQSDVPQSFIGPVVAEAAVWPNTDWWNNFHDRRAVVVHRRGESQQPRSRQQPPQPRIRAARAARGRAGALADAGAHDRRRDVVLAHERGRRDRRARPARATRRSSTALFSYTGIVTKPATYARDLTDYDSSRRAGRGRRDEHARARDVHVLPGAADPRSHRRRAAKPRQRGGHRPHRAGARQCRVSACRSTRCSSRSRSSSSARRCKV